MIVIDLEGGGGTTSVLSKRYGQIAVEVNSHDNMLAIVPVIALMILKNGCPETVALTMEMSTKRIVLTQ